MENVLVLKFGGSSIASPDLRRWVEATEQSTRPVVVVPGGGPFANTVRQYQTRIGYDNDAAHHMAILAMEQFGWALISLGQRFVPAATLEAIQAALARGEIPVWMPAKLVGRDAGLEKSWSVTSDSLAAWLAGRIAGSALCLIKQIDLPPDSSIEAIAAAGVVDPAFTALLHPATRVHVAGPADAASSGRRLAGGVVPGREIARESARMAMGEAAQ